VNLDDLKDFRPGLKASGELGVLSPLADEKFTKADIRYFSRQMGLETWDKPSQSCLATRIPYDTVLRGEDLVKVEEAEEFLHDLGFGQVRVRCHGKMARIEFEADVLDVALKKDMRGKISEAFAKIGFENTSVDIDGYQTGKMNKGIVLEGGE
jgi:uncharacterized protein